MPRIISAEMQTADMCTAEKYSRTILGARYNVVTTPSVYVQLGFHIA